MYNKKIVFSGGSVNEAAQKVSCENCEYTVIVRDDSQPVHCYPRAGTGGGGLHRHTDGGRYRRDRDELCELDGAVRRKSHVDRVCCRLFRQLGKG